MIDLSSIYRNPRLPQGYYFTKVIDIDTEEVGLDRLRIEVTLRVGSIHDQQAGTRLSSIIHPTGRAVYYFKNFISTFLVRGNRYFEAVNRWGCIEVYDAQHGKTRYSAVKYVYQPHSVRLRTHEIEEAEKEGIEKAGGERMPMIDFG